MASRRCCNNVALVLLTTAGNVINGVSAQDYVALALLTRAGVEVGGVWAPVKPGDAVGLTAAGL